MEKKRKLPARASARVENANKRRIVTPQERSGTPAPQPVVRKPVVREPIPSPPLPTSIQAGQPLPMTEHPQPEDLSSKEYQSISESGVLAESLVRSRRSWTGEGLFERFWTKPHKRKGVVNENPSNPPKDSMTKVGTLTITIEPHIVEATMFVVKESKLRPPPSPHSQQQQQQQQQPPKPQAQSQPQQPPARPVLQYGPPNGSMPPPPTPISATTTPTPMTVMPEPIATPSSSQSTPQPPPRFTLQEQQQQQQPPKLMEAHNAPVPLSNTALPSSPSPIFPARPAASALAAPPLSARPPSNPPRQHPAPPPLAKPPLPAAATTTPRPPASATPGQLPTTAKPPAPAAPKPAPNDPVIALLAQKASGDAELRDLMKRVAVGQAKDGELAHFQKIIDQLNAEYRRKGGQQGPSADRLLVDGRTVKYFADEVRTILDIVLASNPQQKSSELRPPPRSDPLVVLLVKTALEDQRTKDMIKRIAEGRPGFTDATDLKEILDRLHRDAKTIPQGILPAASPAKQPPSNGLPNGHTRVAPAQTHQQPNSQALRSKGPPPIPKLDISAVVFDFANGDRYLFPKFSILEYLPTTSGQEVVASFLIVRKGSTSQYGGDPKLDYYQPITIRLSTPTGRHLENLARVVAPQEEVRRYMNDVMDNMTRAEYVLLAMRLPRPVKDGERKDGISDEPTTEGLTSNADLPSEQSAETKPSVLWTTRASDYKQTFLIKPRDPEEESETKYKRLIRSVAAKDL